MISVPFRFFRISCMRWIDATVCAWSKLQPGTPKPV